MAASLEGRVMSGSTFPDRVAQTEVPAGGSHIEVPTFFYHPIARELGRLLISRRTLQYQHVPRFEAILHGPDHMPPPADHQDRRSVLQAGRK